MELWADAVSQVGGCEVDEGSLRSGAAHLRRAKWVGRGRAPERSGHLGRLRRRQDSR